MHAWAAPDIARLPGTGPALRLRDTASGELVRVADGPTARMYVCGITPYDATHLGHAATYVTFDLASRVLRDGGQQVRYVQNITDVDDPLLERAQATGQDWRELADREVQLFREDMSALRVMPPHVYAGAVESIPLVADMVAQLREAGHAYEVDADLYFSVGSDERFGAVSGLDRAAMLTVFAERGGDPGRPGKKDPLDPLLWQGPRPGEPRWDSVVGPGRPGWHVECAAIALEHLGMSFDLQGGGRDLIFPHHEMSASHAQVLTGQAPFARCYAHAAMVGLDGQKMSKSLGNLVLVSSLRAQGSDPAAIRLALLSHHHRADWGWTSADLVSAGQRLDRWRHAVRAPAGPPAGSLLAGVRAALADDLDSPAALAVVDRWVDQVATGPRGGEPSPDPAAPRLVADTVDALLGIRL